MKNYKYENQQLELTKVSLICLNMNYIQFFQITYFESLIFFVWTIISKSFNAKHLGLFMYYEFKHGNS